MVYWLCFFSIFVGLAVVIRVISALCEWIVEEEGLGWFMGFMISTFGLAYFITYYLFVNGKLSIG